MIHEMQATNVHVDGVDIHVSLYIMALDLEEIGTVSSIFIENIRVDYFLKFTPQCFCGMEIIIQMTKTPTEVV